ncbi:MAG: hypothetical protein AAGA72_00480 [Pseudomonadota bacterium]
MKESKSGDRPYFLTSIQPGPNAYELFAEDGLISRTSLAPTYFEGTTVLKTLSVDVLDRRAALVSDLVEIVGILGGDLTFLSRTANIKCAGISAAEMNAILSSSPRVGTQSTVTISDANAKNCDAQMTIGPVDADAISTEQFEEAFVDIGQDVGVIASSVCRTIEIEAFGIQKQTLRVPDPNYVRVSRVPTNGKLDFSDLCAPPSVTSENDSVKAEFDFLKAMLGAFQNPSED